MKSFCITILLLGVASIWAADPARKEINLESSPFSAASPKGDSISLTVKGNWILLLPGKESKVIKRGEQIVLNPHAPITLSERHTQMVICHVPEQGILLTTTFDARSFGGKEETTNELLKLK
ncbi:MAG: hypothetical protein IAE97_10080 [Chthoniobacterales bacterium]|nr:hypothetical protein [Chthoniobacterales bacterium]